MKLREVLYGPGVQFIERSIPSEYTAPLETPTTTGKYLSTPPPRTVTEPIMGAEVEEIVQTWATILGINLNADMVRKHLVTLRRWEERRLKADEQGRIVN